MTKIQLKRIYKKIFTYNHTEMVEYNSMEEIAKALETKYTLDHKEIKVDKIYYNEFIVDTYKTQDNKVIVGNIIYYTKNNQIKQLF